MYPLDGYIVLACIGCDNILPGSKCAIWVSPSAKMSKGSCGTATHIKREGVKKVNHVRVGQQKQKRKKQ
jgi:hypothetical protein